MATGNVLVGLGTATFHVSIMPYLMASTSPAERRQAFSIRWALFSFGAFMGSILGGLLPPSIALATSTSPGDAQPFRYSLFLGGVLLAGSLWAVWKARELRIDPHATTGGANHPFPLGLLAIFGVAVFLLAIAEGAGYTFFNVYLDTKLAITTFQIGVIIALARIAGIPASLAAPGIARRIGNGQTVALGIARYGDQPDPPRARSALGRRGRRIHCDQLIDWNCGSRELPLHVQSGGRAVEARHR